MTSKKSISSLAKRVTKKSSFQTYVTIKLLVDKGMADDCFKAYAYFRWLDDQVDIHYKTKQSRISFITRQRQLIKDSYQKLPVKTSCPEEKMIVELIESDSGSHSKLSSFILNFFDIIEFDAHRKGSLISQKELTWYSKTLAIAVTDGIEHFINHSYKYPDAPHHYDAAIAAHIIHMLRDYLEDLPEGFINIPDEYLKTHKLRPSDTDTAAFKSWVKQQTAEARKKLQLGKQYISMLSVLKGKIAASWYCARFEGVISEIEKNNYQLTNNYHHSNPSTYFRFVSLAGQITINHLFNSKK